jgi:hypothetical protein
MTIRLFLSAGIAAAATSFSGQAAAQTSTSGSVTIAEPGGVNLLQNTATPRSGGVGEVTFVLSTQINGSLAVQLPGFVAQASNGGTMLLLDDEGGRSVTGTTMASEALSLSFSSGAESAGPQGSRSAASNITVLLAQYN